MKSKHTKKEVELSNETTGLFIKESNTYDRAICHFYDRHDAKGNALIMADAINVTNETGLTPRELQKSHDELLEALESINELLRQSSQYELACKTIAEQAIKNATK